MREFDRRLFLAGSASAALLLQAPSQAFAQGCVTGSYPAFLPSSLTVDYASKRNFALFRQNDTYLGLAGVVSMTAVEAKSGSFQAGNLFLFPWLKPKGIALGPSKVWNAAVPASATGYRSASPLPGSTLPQDEYFCNLLLGAAPAMFIGFLADVPFAKLDAKLGLYSNVDKLADGKPVGIDWASSNLNNPWFGGSRQVPATATCNGAGWRKLIIAGLNAASR
jgi:hypothetical protein